MKGSEQNSRTEIECTAGEVYMRLVAISKIIYKDYRKTAKFTTKKKGKLKRNNTSLQTNKGKWCV